MDIILKNAPEYLIKFKSIDFNSIDELLKFHLDFKEVEEKKITQSMINSMNKMDEEIKKNGYKNFTSLSSY